MSGDKTGGQGQSWARGTEEGMKLGKGVWGLGVQSDNGSWCPSPNGPAC